MFLVLGATGYIGSAVKNELETRYLRHYCISRSQVDYTDKINFEQLLRTHKPHCVINCAGVTGKPNVDACESNKIECLLGNVILPVMLSECCLQHGVKFGHISSGCIYTGLNKIGNPHTEEDEPNFTFKHRKYCSWYSGCKALAEEILDENDMYIWRLRIPFNSENNPRNFIYKILNYDRLLNADNSVSHLGEFATACVDSVLNRVPYGIYNVTNTGFIDAKQIVEIICSKRRDLIKDFKYFESESEFLKTVKTPRSNCVLDNTKSLNAGLNMRDVSEAITESVVLYR